MLITKIKVSQVTNLSEARYCAGMGVDFLSFPISSIDPETYQEITGWVAGPKFGVAVQEQDIHKAHEYEVDFIEIKANLIGSTHLENLIVSVEMAEWPTMKSHLLRAKKSILYVELTVAALDAETLGVVQAVAQDFQILIKPSGKIDLDKVLKWPIAGLSFDGNAETRPGLKEYPLSEILEQLEANE